ncbi:MAG TPA: adenylosuccinate lyase [Steroidobacteraceae bacterium]|nr:adenylosuccinate lyase [Steroidobacteraceae bacterium]
MLHPSITGAPWHCTANDGMTSSELDALSPVDGRYAAKLSQLRYLCSEAGLIRLRVRIEALWWQHLARNLSVATLKKAPSAVQKEVARLATDAAAVDPAAVKAIEARINHDVKAVEYYVRERLQAAGAEAAHLEFVHFACTSEDINNLAYALMLAAARQEQLLPALSALIEQLRTLAHAQAETPMLARTHGQPASPTTLGKEVANFVARLRRAQQRFERVEILGKFNGAVGNFNAHVAGFPDVAWPRLAQSFVESLELGWNPYSTQIEPHDWIAEYCDALAGINTVLIDAARDFWGYIALGYFRQRVAANEVGSSTMPHKVNPIDFENAEGNLGLANAQLRHFADKLPVSRWQRDLSDSTVMRNIGVALGQALLALQALQRGVGRLDVDTARLRADLDSAWEVLAEPVQTIMRAHGLPDGYERLKAFTRGQPVDRERLHAFIQSLDLPAEARRRLLELTPADYVGLAARLARDI